MHWKIADLSPGGNSSKSLWHPLSGGSEPSWDTKCLPDFQSLSWPQHNFTQVGIKSVCYRQQTLLYAEGLKSNLPKPATQKMIACASLCVCVCVLFCKYLTTSELLTPGKEGSLSGRLQQSSAPGCWTHSVGGVWASCLPHSPVNSARSPVCGSLQLGVGRGGWTGEQGKGWNGGPDWVLWKIGITSHESSSKYRAKRLDEQSP